MELNTQPPLQRDALSFRAGASRTSSCFRTFRVGDEVTWTHRSIITAAGAAQGKQERRKCACAQTQGSGFKPRFHCQTSRKSVIVSK